MWFHLCPERWAARQPKPTSWSRTASRQNYGSSRRDKSPCFNRPARGGLLRYSGPRGACCAARLSGIDMPPITATRAIAKIREARAAAAAVYICAIAEAVVGNDVLKLRIVFRFIQAILRADADEQFINKWIFHPLNLPRHTRTLLRVRRVPDREFSKKFSPNPRWACVSANLQAIGSISLPVSILVSANRRAFSPRGAAFPRRGTTRAPSF